jgi:hypothetical protein
LNREGILALAQAERLRVREGALLSRREPLLLCRWRGLLLLRRLLLCASRADEHEPSCPNRQADHGNPAKHASRPSDGAFHSKSLLLFSPARLSPQGGHSPQGLI